MSRREGVPKLPVRMTAITGSRRWNVIIRATRPGIFVVVAASTISRTYPKMVGWIRFPGHADAMATGTRSGHWIVVKGPTLPTCWISVTVFAVSSANIKVVGREGIMKFPV